MLKNVRDGQSIFEYVALFAIIIAVLVSMQAYVKRAIAGGLRQAVDSVGEQYSPRHTDGRITLDTYSQRRTCTVLLLNQPLDNVNRADVMVTDVRIFNENSVRNIVTEKVDTYDREGFWED